MPTNTKLKNLIAYLLLHQPKHSLSGIRLTRLAYLADWKHVLEEGKQISSTAWFYSTNGPDSRDVLIEVKKHPDLFHAEAPFNPFRHTVSCLDCSYKPQLEQSERDAADHVLKAVKDLDAMELAGLINSTYPLIVSELYTNLDLIAAAQEYKITPVYQNVTPR